MYFNIKVKKNKSALCENPNFDNKHDDDNHYIHRSHLSHKHHNYDVHVDVYSFLVSGRLLLFRIVYPQSRETVLKCFINESTENVQYEVKLTDTLIIAGFWEINAR